ncbi:TetR/AcrR family transcriptional regulator [Priestia endophytica]|jgi:TetR/AcrR family transcriptional regulator, fatty acid metabolism regulator protein|uniref:TetR/AcrR family transcriptional regulator n=1 Tax=Priestia endophytica TaxID=135735 RepID=UPI000DCA338D|nr:TetR/AcrR family transcriptional regulator [Priestia endophytica]KAB2495723.1 TetR/AcrR family transcriptional regulator [Priestia endophytica]RAS82452.1 TetR family transcriptional regulator [Priestia endophytica]RAS88951.1 TetR family transcriptional regulator [Priestia endophytica]
MNRNRPKFKQILDAAVVVIAEHGYHSSQVSKIAKQAGVADGTIYLYFKNKEDILISLFQEKMGQFIERIQEDIQKEETASEKLFFLIQRHITFLSEDQYLAAVTQLELRQTNRDIRNQINEVLKGYLEIIDEILESGIESGEFQEELDARLARQMIFGTIDEVVTTWVMNEYKYDITKLIPKVHKLLLHGCKR